MDYNFEFCLKHIYYSFKIITSSWDFILCAWILLTIAQVNPSSMAKKYVDSNGYIRIILTLLILMLLLFYNNNN